MWTHFYCAGALDASVMLSIFVASIRAVGCAATLAAAGLWMARRGLMTPQLSKGLSQLSVKLAIPALLFGSVVPGISLDTFTYAWPLLLLPAVYLLLGALIGLLMLVIVQPPADFRLGVVAACTFGNTTGIPVIVLSVLQQSLSRSVFADVADPLLFLSLMLVTLPLFQWLAGLVLLRVWRRGRRGEAERWCLPASRCCDLRHGCFGLCHGCYVDDPLRDELDMLRDAHMTQRPIRRGGPGEESSSYISMMSQGEDEVVPYVSIARPESVSERLAALVPDRKVALDWCRGAAQLVRSVCVPQVVGIVAGGLVGLYGRQYVLPPETAPLGWLYLGITKLGAAAVPINLILLGASRSRTRHRHRPLPRLSTSTSTSPQPKLPLPPRRSALSDSAPPGAAGAHRVRHCGRADDPDAGGRPCDRPPALDTTHARHTVHGRRPLLARDSHPDVHAHREQHRRHVRPRRREPTRHVCLHLLPVLRRACGSARSAHSLHCLPLPDEARRRVLRRIHVQVYVAIERAHGPCSHVPC